MSRENGQMRVGVRELRSNLAMYLRAAADGNRIVVTQDGDAVAVLTALGDGAEHGGTTTSTQLSALAPEVLAAVGLAEPPRDQSHKIAHKIQRAETHDVAPIQLPVGVSCSAILSDLRGTYTRRSAPRTSRRAPNIIANRRGR